MLCSILCHLSILFKPVPYYFNQTLRFWSLHFFHLKLDHPESTNKEYALQRCTATKIEANKLSKHCLRTQVFPWITSNIYEKLAQVCGVMIVNAIQTSEWVRTITITRKTTYYHQPHQHSICFCLVFGYNVYCVFASQMKCKRLRSTSVHFIITRRDSNKSSLEFFLLFCCVLSYKPRRRVAK